MAHGTITSIVLIIRYFCSSYALFLFNIFPIIFNYGMVSAAGKWECADSKS